MVPARLPRGKWPGTRREVLGAGAGPVSSPVTSDPRTLFPFGVKGQNRGRLWVRNIAFEGEGRQAREGVCIL